MEINGIMKNIAASSIYKKEVGTSFQLGLPRFLSRENELFIKFYPHLERYSNETLSYYLPQYELELVYPFRHVVLFRNLSYTINERCITKKDPVCKIHTRDLAANADYVRVLFSLADDVIYCREENSDNLQYLVLNYDRQYILTAESMGLQAIYGGTYDSHSCL